MGTQGTGGHVDDAALQSKLGCLPLHRERFTDLATGGVLGGSDTGAPLYGLLSATALNRQLVLDANGEVINAIFSIKELQDANLLADLLLELLYVGSATSTVNGSIEIALKGLNDETIVNAFTSPDALVTLPIATLAEKQSLSDLASANTPGIFANDRSIQVGIKMVTKPTTSNVYPIALHIYYEKEYSHASGIRQVLS